MIKLVESFFLDPGDYIKINSLREEEKTIIVEDKGREKQEYVAKAVFTFPISRPGKENLNGRIYNEKLWNNTVKSLKNSSTFGLMDHPDSEGSTKDIWCVWRNLRFSESKETVVADAYLIGEWGQMVKEILEAGGKVGLSTSGYGEFLEDQKTVNPDSFELERVADFVFNPSYEVYGSIDDKKEGVKEVDNMKIVLDKKENNLKEGEVKKNNIDEAKAMGSFKPGRYVADTNNGVVFHDNDSLDKIFGAKAKEVKEVSPEDFLLQLKDLKGAVVISAVFKPEDSKVWKEIKDEFGVQEDLDKNKEEEKDKKKEEEPEEVKEKEKEKDKKKEDDSEGDEDEVEEKKKKKEEDDPEDDEVEEKKKKKESASKEKDEDEDEKEKEEKNKDKKKEETPEDDDEVEEKKKKEDTKEKKENSKEKDEDEDEDDEVEEKKKKKEAADTSTFKCPDCGGKVLTNTEYCVSCKKKVKNPKDDKKEEVEEESLMEKFFRQNIQASFKLAKNEETAEMRIKAYEELISYFDEGVAENLKQDIEAELQKERASITVSEEVSEKSSEVDIDSLLSEKSALEEKYKNALDLLDSVKVYTKKLKEMFEIVQAEKNGMVTATEYKEMQVYLEGVEQEKVSLELELFNLKNTPIEEEVAKDLVEDKKPKLDLEKISPDVLRYYNTLEDTSPSVIVIKEDILRCRTLMEAQKTALRLKPLWETVESAYDRKFVGNKDTFIESSKQRLPIKDGWM